MSKESLIFSVLGLTVRGFHRNDDKWVPKGGQRLPCALCSGAIDVLKDDQSVGKVATEAPNKFKDWLKAEGNIEAVVTGLPKKHRGKKGVEVPVVFVFRSKKNCRMINFKNAITTGILKLKKRKKSVEVADGDASEEMTFSDNDENLFEFSVLGMTMRGFQVYNELWVPKIGDRILCSVSGDHSVEMVKDGKTIGHVQTEGQKLFRRFINENGVIYAIVNGEPKQHKSKGEEIPVIFEFSADDWTNRLQNIRNEIQNDIKKRSKKRKCLQFICSEESQNEAGPSCDMQSVDMAGGSGENMMESSVTEVIDKSHPEGNMENGAGEKVSYRNTSSVQVKKSLKRRSDERAGGSEEKIIKTEEEVKDNKRSVKNKQDLLKVENLPRTESSKNTKQIPKKEYVPTAETEKDPKTKQFQEKTNQPKTIKVLSSAFANQKDEKENADQRNKEDDKLDSENSEIKFPLVSSKSQQSFGSFIDTHGHVETVLQSDAKSQASHSVCKINFPTIGGYADATGFRVGSRYIMTAAHVTNAFLEGLQYAAETYAQFNYKLDGIFREEDKYLIKEVVYSNQETDIAVIELHDHPNGFPPSLTAFLPPCPGGFYLIGHSQGSVMITNIVNKIIDKDCPKMQHTLGQLREKSLKHTSGRGYDTPPYDTVDNPYRFLFQCKFSKGASGAPGIVLIGGTIYVTTVLVHGYPDWYYDTSMETFKSNWLPEHCVQQGVDLMSVRDMMNATHPSLCQDIFGKQQ